MFPFFFVFKILFSLFLNSPSAPDLCMLIDFFCSVRTQVAHVPAGRDDTKGGASLAVETPATKARAPGPVSSCGGWAEDDESVEIKAGKGFLKKSSSSLIPRPHLSRQADTPLFSFFFLSFLFFFDELAGVVNVLGGKKNQKEMNNDTYAHACRCTQASSKCTIP